MNEFTAASRSSSLEDFEFDASVDSTVTAWSKASMPRRRAFGTKGKGRSARSFRTTKMRESPSEESGFLGGDSTSPPEKNLFSRDNVVEEDSATDFNPHAMPQRPPPKLTRSSSMALLGRDSMSPPEKNLFSRDNVVEEHSATDFNPHAMPRRPPPKLTRSSSLALPEPYKRHSRSGSLNLFSSGARERDSSDATTSTDEDQAQALKPWAENANPNHFEEYLEAELKSGGSRKKPFRRSSIHGGSTTPLSDLMSIAQVKADLGTPTWLNPDKTSPAKGLDFGDLTDCGSGITSSPARSVASSRKRGVNGSPFSDIDDWSSTGGLSASMNSSSSLSARRSRSRIYSLVPGVPLPFAPSMKAAAGSAGEGRSSNEDLRTMDVESDGHASDSDGSNAGNSPDTSFESASGHPSFLIPWGKQVSDESAGNGDDIFETMSSYGDLKFLIKTLRRESEGRCAMGNSWNVAPPAGWTSSRRGAFFQWSTRHLGFDVRATGGAFNYLQISRTRGAEVLSKLEEALVSYKQKEVDKQKQKSPDLSQDAFSFMDTSCSARKPPAEKNLRMESIGNHVHSLFDADMDYGTAALTNEMETLTVKEQPITSDASLIRHVTLEAESAYKAPPRPSFDRQTGSQDLMLHLNGDSSEDESIRPSKMSMGSMCSTGSFNRHRGSAPFATHVPIQTHDFVETPLMKQDEGWGSRPVQGRDWGNSCTCDLNVIDALLSEFEESGRRAGVRDSFGSSPSNAGSTQRFARSTNLALDMEENIILEQDSQLDETLQSQQDDEENEKKLRRRKVSYAKHKRMSLWASTAQAGAPLLSQQKPLFRTMKSLAPVDESMRQSLLHHKDFPLVNNADCQLFEDTSIATLTNEAVLSTIFSCLNESELLSKASLVCTAWADAATSAHARLMMTSVGYVEPSDDVDDELDEIEIFDCSEKPITSVALSMQRSWQYLNNLYPWGCFLSEGAFKRVYKVHNSNVGVDEALSVMDVDKIVDKQTIAAELVVSSMLSSLARRAVCPNFILTHGVFTCPYEPAESRWGSADNKRPKGDSYVKGKADRRPREPGTAYPGRYQYIRMELCTEGDAEEFVKRHPEEALDLGVARMFLFQIAFALHAAADKFSLKHYDLKLLNVFVQDAKAASSDQVVLRYGLGSHVFALKMAADTAVIAKLADYGTANIKADSNGQPATIAQFTTLENTPPDFMILGDKATQGHGHDAWGLGLCMLHLFTGHAPYEEVLEEIKCPPGLKKKLRQIWENENVAGYEVIHSVVLSDVYKDEAGNIIEGEPDETLYDTLYRFLVLFGIPVDKFQQKTCPKVWQAISESLEGASKAKGGRPVRKKHGSKDASQFHRDRKKFSIRSGNNQYIARARNQLETVDGGMDLLFHLCSFDPDRRASAMDVLNSSFMEDLREPSTGEVYALNDTVHSYTAFSTTQR